MPRKRVDVTERALEVPDELFNDPKFKERLANPFGSPSRAISLKAPYDQWVVRWCNTTIVPDKFWRDQEKGWKGVTPAMLIDKNQVGMFQTTPDGYVARGERCSEVLIGMPKKAWQMIQQAKVAYNNRNMGNPMKTKNEVVEAAGQQLGSEAADFLNKRVRAVGGVTDKYEVVQRAEGVE